MHWVPETAGVLIDCSDLILKLSGKGQVSSGRLNKGTSACNVPGFVSVCVRLVSDTHLSNIYQYIIIRFRKDKIIDKVILSFLKLMMIK